MKCDQDYDDDDDDHDDDDDDAGNDNDDDHDGINDCETLNWKSQKNLNPRMGNWIWK